MFPGATQRRETPENTEIQTQAESEPLQGQGLADAEPQLKAKGVAINDDPGLKGEADLTGERKARESTAPVRQRHGTVENWEQPSNSEQHVIQRVVYENEAAKNAENAMHRADAYRALGQQGLYPAQFDADQGVLDVNINDIYDGGYTLEYFIWHVRALWADMNSEPETLDEAYDPHSDWNPSIPKDADQTHNGFTLHNDDIGCLDGPNGFESAGPGLTQPPVDIRQSVRFAAAADLKDTRYQHFKAANQVDGHPALGGKPPEGWTWHHHRGEGEMQLVNRELHAAFFHRGGYSVWGS